MEKYEKLPPIPVPKSVIWREFRIRVLPVMVFLVVVAGCVFLWKDVGRGGMTSGVAEGVRSTVASPRFGFLADLKVQSYDVVQAGQVLGHLVPVDTRANFDLLQSEMQLARMRLEPSMPDRNAMNFEQVRIDWLRLKMELAVAKVGYLRASNTVARNTPLLKDRLVSEDAYELLLRDRDTYQAQIEEITKSLVEIEDRMNKLRSLGEPTDLGTNAVVSEAIARLEERLVTAQTNLAPVPILAPISGMVHMLYRNAGEYVADGEVVLTINSTHADRIVAYLRQPYPIEPQIGRKVEVITRTKKRQRFEGEISQISAQVEMITNSLAFIAQGSLVDVGLPVVIPVPRGFSIRPGEIVDVTFPTLTGMPSATAPRRQEMTKRP